MELLPIIFTVVVAHFLALLSPGPDFVIVVKSGVRSAKKAAIGVAFGIAAANAIYIVLCIVGIGAVLAKSIVIMTMLKISGGIFLAYLAVMSAGTRKSDYEYIVDNARNSFTRSSSFMREFMTGFMSGILNPKNPIFYLSLFSLILTNDVNSIVKIGLGVWMTVLVFSWDAFIIFVLSRNAVRRVFSRLAFYIDKVTGAILGLIGVKLIQSAVVGISGDVPGSGR